MNRAFPAAILALQIGAAVVYGFSGDVRRCLYWAAAAVLTIVVTW